jgi:hypothetical protein
MGDVLQVARIWAKAGINDAQIAATLAKQHRAMVMQSMSPGGLNTVTSATKNGVSMGKTMGLSIPDTMEAMGYALGWIENGCIPCQSRSLGRF